jgi:predicted RNA-binding protein with PIN domain
MDFTFDGIVMQAESFPAALKHLKDHQPDVYEDVVTDRIAVAVSDSAEQAQIDANRAEEAFQRAVLKGIERVLFNHENRIRVLEGKAAITREQFITALKTLLGI